MSAAKTQAKAQIEARHYDVILSPVITEKATVAAELNKVVFKVRNDASKPQIVAAVERLFDVKVEKINTMTVRASRRASAAFAASSRTSRWPPSRSPKATGST